ncbi:MAG: ABC transporter ATP-binding protein [Proteobacteria bacterium]|nr:ABC transporter ATP-binding protein [Pseudomonadota bacterium]
MLSRYSERAVALLSTFGARTPLHLLKGDWPHREATRRSPPADDRADAERGIFLRSVVLERGGHRVFDGLTLDLVEPRIGIIGDNGAGKSSLLRLIAGLEQPVNGQLTVHGHSTHTEHGAVARRVGLMFQNPDDQILCPTVEEELAFTLSARGASKTQAREQARDFLTTWGLSHWAPRAISQLSQGQRQKVCLLALQIAQPLTLLLDEPFASLDLPSQLRLGRQLLSADQQLIFSTHVLEQVCDFQRVIWLESGRVRADGPGQEVCQAYREDVKRRAIESAETAEMV